MFRNIDFTSWQSLLVTLIGLALFTLISIGIRLLLIEFRPWSGPRKNWWTAIAGAGIVAGLAFALGLAG